MSDVSEYVPTKIRNTLGRKTDLPSTGTRSTGMSKLLSLVLNARGMANIANSFGSAKSSIALTTTVTPGAMATDGQFLYVCSEYTTFAKIDRIDIDDFTQVYSTLDISSYVSFGLYGCEIVGRKLYIVTFNSPAELIKIDLDSFTVDSVIILSKNMGTCIKSDGTDLYIGHLTATTFISKVNIATFSEIVPALDTGNGLGTYSLQIDDVYLYVTQIENPTKVTRIFLSSFTVESSLTFLGAMASGQGTSSCIRGTYLYVSAYTGKVHQIDLNTFTVTKTITTTTNYVNGSVIGITGTYLIVIGMPATVLQKITFIDLATFTEFGIFDMPANNNLLSFCVDGTFCYFGLSDGTVFRKYIQPSTPVESRLIDILSNVSVDTTVLQADIGDASASTLGSLYGILGNPATDLATTIDLIRGDTRTIEDWPITTDAFSPVAGSLASFIATGGVSLGTQLPASKSLYDFLISADTAGTHDITTVNDKTETDVVEVTATTRYGLSCYFDLNALVSAAEGGTVTLRMYNKIDETNYREIAKATFVVGTTTTHPNFEAIRLNHNTKFTIQCSTDVTVTRTINYRYIKEAKE